MRFQCDLGADLLPRYHRGFEHCQKQMLHPNRTEIATRATKIALESTKKLH